MVRSILACIGWALLIALAGCSSTRELKVQDQVASADSGIHEWEGQKIIGYVTADAIYHKFKGRVRLVFPDTLEFLMNERYEGETPKTRPVPFRMARDSVQTLMATHQNTVGTIVTVLAIAVAIVAVAEAIAVATKESCPFIYSYDGERFVFDGEPYGGATMRGLERTDWSQLDHLVPVHGRFRLLLSNEVDETQHTNSLSLLVVDHPPGSTVVMDKDGHPHAFLGMVPLLAAHDETGRDLWPWLQADDAVAWQPDIKAYSRSDSLPDTRNHITLVFPRPTGVARAYLVSNVATNQWGSHMIRTMLGMRGDRVQEFYAAINGSEVYREQLFAWNAREELFELFPEIQCGTTWKRQDFIPAGGPFISESRAVPLDLSCVEGDSLQIRIHPPIGFWSLNSFHLAWEEAEARETKLSPERAGKSVGSDAVAALQSDDADYLDFPNTGDQAEINFAVPSRHKGMNRTIFARTRGWYEVHLYRLGKPDVAGLTRLSEEPGYAVRRALREFAEYQRTGVLLGVKNPMEPATP